MSELKHTPGPWLTREGADGTASYIFQKGETESFLAVAHSYSADALGRRPNRATRQANARLIAAAPQLLEVLRDDLKAWENVLEFGLVAPGYRAGVEARIATIRAAIAAATGAA